MRTDMMKIEAECECDCGCACAYECENPLAGRRVRKVFASSIPRRGFRIDFALPGVVSYSGRKPGLVPGFLRPDRPDRPEPDWPDRLDRTGPTGPTRT